jgi:D-inositol-3-phosphate glycosyltransferase
VAAIDALQLQPAQRLLLIGHWAAGSGLTRVLGRIALELAPRTEVRILGLMPAGGRPVEPPAGVEVHEVPQRGPRFRVDPLLLRQHMAEFRPHDVIVMGPAFLIAFVVEALQPFRGTSRIVLYLSVEGEMVSPIPLHLLDLADTCMLYTEDARARLESLAGAAPSGERAALAVLGHGVDTEVFSPVNASAGDVRRELFPHRPELHDAFLVLNSNRAYPRKRLDLTIAGFAQFARDHPDAYLYLNACGLGVRGRAELEGVIEKAGVTGRVLLNLLNPDGSPLPDGTLRLLYNACEVGVTTSMGEGWGLGTFEHAATAAAQIVPDHTTFSENWHGAAALLPQAGRVHVFYEYSDMVEVRASDLAHELERLYGDRDLLRRMSQTAYNRATEPRFAWDAIGRRLGAILADRPAPVRIRQARPHGCWKVAGDWQGERSRSSL